MAELNTSDNTNVDMSADTSVNTNVDTSANTNVDTSANTNVDTSANTSPKKEITKEDVEHFIKMATKLVSLACDRLITKQLPEVKSLLPKPEEPGHVSISFREMPERLNMCFILAPNPYRMEIDVPPGYEKEVCSQYILLKQLAITYWESVITNNAGLSTYLDRLENGEQYKHLKVCKTHTLSLYFDEEFTHRVCILPYYVNASGQPLVKNR
jgi:hypothetical protein